LNAIRRVEMRWNIGLLMHVATYAPYEYISYMP
jgi:hypothetical protein